MPDFKKPIHAFRHFVETTRAGCETNGLCIAMSGRRMDDVLDADGYPGPYQKTAGIEIFPPGGRVSLLQYRLHAALGKLSRKFSGKSFCDYIPNLKFSSPLEMTKHSFFIWITK